jgi:hypothetical protein
MTDENTRPGSDPGKQPAEGSDPQDTPTPDVPTEPTTAGEMVEASVTSETVVNVPAGATVERVDAPEPEAPADDAAAPESDAATDEAATSADEPVEAVTKEAIDTVEEAPPESAAAESAVADTDTVEPAATEAPPETAADEPIEADAPAEAEVSEVRGEADTEPIAAVAAEAPPGDTFVWHPELKGKTVGEVRAALAQDIAADQRQHRLAMDGAEESEQEALASVVSLERKWGQYDFDWAEQDPERLAERIIEFERERERRQELISWSDYRNADVELDEAQVAGERPAELSTGAKSLSLLLVILLIVVILLAVWAL